MQYAIIQKLNALKMFCQRGVLTIQNTSLSKNKECYKFRHFEKRRPVVEKNQGAQVMLRKDTLRKKFQSVSKTIADMNLPTVEEGGKCPVCKSTKPTQCTIEEEAFFITKNNLSDQLALMFRWFCIAHRMKIFQPWYKV